MTKHDALKKLILSLLLVVCSLGAYSQKVITGTVIDAEGPLVGASVVIKDATVPTGTVTDADGNYSIRVPNSKAVLLFSYIGYKDMAEPVGKRKVINVTMEEDSQLLDDVVVIGYGTQTKSHLTGAVSKLEGDALLNTPVSDVTTALQGMMTGLTVNNNTSEVGVAPAIRVRGIGSISADSDPLVIIDGFPVSDGLSYVNAADISSIEILKDAASAAIYGSRAANGVIMVTTKSGTPNKPKYTFKFYQGWKYAYQLHDIMTSNEWLELLTEEEALGGESVLSAARASAYIENNIGATDWQREGLHDVIGITNAQLSVSGGNKGNRYYLSVAYNKDHGIMLQNESDKLNFRSKLDAQLSKIATVGVNISGMYKKVRRPKNNFIDFYRTPSFMPVYHNDFTTALTGYTGFARGSHFNKISTPTGTADEDGNPTYETSTLFSSTNNNPKCVMANTFRWNETFQGMVNAYFTLDIAKGLQFKTSDGLSASFSPSYYYANENAIKDGTESEATYFSSLIIRLLSENTLTYHLDFGPGKSHTLDALAGYTLESRRRQRVALSATGFATDNIHTLNAATVFSLASEDNGNTDGTGTFRYPDTVLESYLGRINYSYLGRYLLSASIRLDRSSLFSKGNRNAWFPSVSLGWRVSEEKFMKKLDAISNLKLRFSYGVTGNNGISYDAALQVLNSANYVTGSGNGSLVSGTANTSDTLANSEITWEKTDEFNYGLDLGLFNNRINLTVDAYYSVTRALLFEQPTQSFTGYSYYWNNIGKVRNTGVEIQLETHNLKKRNLTWDTSINFSLSRNKLLELGGESQVINQGERSECYIAKVGSPLIQYYGYLTDGVWKTTEEVEANPHFSSDVAGGLRIVDTNGDGALTTDDRVPLGDPYPSFTWGITNNFRIKQFDISFLIQGVQGITVYNGDVYYNETTKWNKAYTKGRWVSETYTGNGYTPYLKYGYDFMLTDYPLQNASYACLRNLTIGYTLPTTAARKLHVSGVRFYVTGNNLFYIWSGDYKGVNPESRYTSSYYSSAMIDGYQRGGFPLTSTVCVGFDINF